MGQTKSKIKTPGAGKSTWWPKSKKSIIALSSVVGMVVWLLDVIIDYAFFFNDSFANLLYKNLTPHEIKIKLVSLIGFLMFGYLISVIVQKIIRSEDALLEGEEKHRPLFETMAQGVIYQDADGKITSANPAAEKILGLSYDQMQGRTSMDPRWKPIHEDGSDFPGETHPSIVALKTGKKVLDKVMGVFNPQKEDYTWININAVPLCQKGEKKPFQVYITFEDITERKRAEEKLKKAKSELETKVIERTESLAKTNVLLRREIKEREQSENALHASEELHRLTLTNISDAVYITNDTGDFTFVCPNVDILFGYTYKEMNSFGNISGLFGDNLFDLNNLNRTGKLTNIEREISNKFGQKRDVLVNIKKVSVGKGTILFSCRDITERKQAELSLQEAEAELKHTIEVVPGIIAKVSAHTGYFTHCNPALISILGFSSEEFLARPFIEFVHPDDRQSTINEVEKQLKGSPVARFKNRYICKDGSYKWLEWRTTAADEKGIIYAAATDITERKRAEERFNNTHADLISEQIKLRTKNVVLREVLRQIDNEKKLLKNQIQSNTNRILLPLLATLKEKTDKNQSEYVDMLEKSLNEITSPFVNQLEVKFSNLSPRELEICNMLKDGLTTKQITSNLDISLHTVLKQRQNIRKKLGIANADINLYTFLKSVSDEALCK